MRNAPSIGIYTPSNQSFPMPRYCNVMGDYRKTYVRQWRQRRGLSLRKLADRLETTPGGDPIVSYASLSRIEKGISHTANPLLKRWRLRLG